MLTLLSLHSLREEGIGMLCQHSTLFCTWRVSPIPLTQNGRKQTISLVARHLRIKQDSNSNEKVIFATALWPVHECEAYTASTYGGNISIT